MPSIKRLTFAGFRASATFTTNLDAHVNDMDLVGVHGTVYAECIALECPDEHGIYDVEIGRAHVRGPLAKVEPELYGFYLCEVADDDVRAYLQDVAPASELFPKDETDTEDSLALLLESFCHFHHLPQESACDLRHREGIPAAAVDWLNDFIDRWDAVVDRVDERAPQPPRAADVRGPAWPALDELLQAARPLAASLTKHITADNAMTPQACMVRRLNAALAAFPE